jgi:hypothetical protein
MENIHTIIIPKVKGVKAKRAIQKVLSAGYKVKKIRETGQSYRFRQRDPSEFVAGSFRTFHIPAKGTRLPGGKGVTVVYGQPKK